MEWENGKTNWYEAVSSALNFSFLKDVSQNCFVFDVVNLKNRKSRGIASFLMLSSAKIEEVSLNCCVFGCCQVQKMRRSPRIASFSILQADRQTDRQTGRERERGMDGWMDGWMDG